MQGRAGGEGRLWSSQEWERRSVEGARGPGLPWSGAQPVPVTPGARGISNVPEDRAAPSLGHPEDV